MTGTQLFLENLERVGEIRRHLSREFGTMAETLTREELIGSEVSGKLGLERQVQDLEAMAEAFSEGVFRLLVLGDMKRGKSTVLNCLIGENLLPCDVNPCTALLTVLRYGSQKQVEIHFNDGKLPQRIDLERFKRDYTIPPEEAKILEQKQEKAFPDVSHAVVEYPLPL